jgi:glutathione S-transferase
MIQIFGGSLSPFARKVLVVAIEKGVAFEVKPIAPGSTDPDFVKASPFGKIPALKDGDFLISDSTAIITYLEAIQPEPNLIPTEPRARARTIWFEEFSDTLVGDCAGKMFLNRCVKPKIMKVEADFALADAAEREIPKHLDYIESVIPASGYLVEDRFTLADIAVASPLANLGYADCPIDAAQYPRVTAYLEAILARPSFAGLIAKEKAILARL